MRRVRENFGAWSGLQPVINPALEAPLLRLHRAMDVNAFWGAVQQVFSIAIPSRIIGLTFRRNPALPVIVRSTRPMQDDFFAAEPLKSYVVGTARKKFVRLRNLFPSRNSFCRSVFYRRHMASHGCAHGFCLFFWKRQRLICGIASIRSAEQGDLSSADVKLLRALHPHFMTALCRIESLERERSVRMDLESFLGRLPLPTIILQWNLKPIYQNQAAREFCAIWEKGPDEAKLTKAASPIPCAILDRCRALKQQWAEAKRRGSSGLLTIFKEQCIQHPQLPYLRATVRLRDVKSAGVARPHFLIECEDLNVDSKQTVEAAKRRLPALVRLTRREQEIARLVCTGQSNKEIAHTVHLSVPMVKKHVHAIFRKLEVPSRSRLVALML